MHVNVCICYRIGFVFRLYAYRHMREKVPLVYTRQYTHILFLVVPMRLSRNILVAIFTLAVLSDSAEPSSDDVVHPVPRRSSASGENLDGWDFLEELSPTVKPSQELSDIGHDDQASTSKANVAEGVDGLALGGHDVEKPAELRDKLMSAFRRLNGSGKRFLEQYTHPDSRALMALGLLAVVAALCAPIVTRAISAA